MSNREELKQRSAVVGLAAVGPEPEACAAWAILLTDAAEGLLNKVEQGAVDAHVAACAGCARELADAQRGAAWMGLLKGYVPEPPAELLQSILARTTGAGGAAFEADLAEMPQLAPALSYGQPRVPAWKASPASQSPANGFAGFWTDLRRWFGAGEGAFPALQPRLAMTAAMAFFSICLTLNLVGFSARTLRAASLRPAGLQRTVAGTGASLVRSFEGIRTVYRVESRVNSWRAANQAQMESPVTAQ